MRNLIITLILLSLTAYILGQIPGDGWQILLVVGVVGSGAYAVGYRHGNRERTQLQAARATRLAEVKG